MHKSHVRPGHYIDPEFVEHCSKMECSVCSFCGSKELSDIDPINNRAKCLNPECDSKIANKLRQFGTVPMSPTLEAIYGEEEHNIDYRQNKSGISGSGLQRDGKPSVSSVMHAIRLAKPRSFIGDNTPGIHTWDMQREIEGTTVSTDSLNL